MSHDLRSPLTAILAAASGLGNPDVRLARADRDELVETIRAEAERLNRIVGNLLDLSRLQSGAATSHQELWTADDLVSRALAELGPRGERIVTELDENAPPVHTDAAQIERALVNLLDNALKFSASGVELRAVGSGAAVLLEVLDRGSGIGDLDPASLLGPFTRGRSGGASGAGLGLAIARGFAEVNGVQLELEAREGGGACARLTLVAEPVP